MSEVSVPSWYNDVHCIMTGIRESQLILRRYGWLLWQVIDTGKNEILTHKVEGL